MPTKRIVSSPHMDVATIAMLWFVMLHVASLIMYQASPPACSACLPLLPC